MSSRQKLLILEIVIFIAVGAFLMAGSKWLLAYGVKHSDNAQTAKVNLIMQHAVDPEIMIFGSSAAEVSFNSKLISKQTSKNVYNAALDGTKMNQNKYLLEEFLSYSKRSEVIVMGLSFFSLSPYTGLTEPSRFYSYFDNKRIGKMFFENDSLEYKKLAFIPFYAFSQYKHTYYKNSLIGFKNIFKKNSLTPDSLDGFVPHYTSWYGEEIPQSALGTQTIEFSDDTINLLSELITSIASSNRKVVVVICPLYIQAQKYYSNYIEYKNKIKGFGDMGAVVLDFTELPLNYDKKYFYNNGHVNAAGAVKFSKAFSKELKNIL